MRLIVGLGNPGPQYVWSRHNAGWLVIDHLVQRLGLGAPREKFRSLFWESVQFGGEVCCLMKPTTYMNLSGLAVVEAFRYFRLEPSSVMVVYDDVSLPFGRLRMRDHGSSGGQKGMASIIAALNTSDVPRLRVGVGAPPESIDLAHWVLSPLSGDERLLWDRVAQCAADALSLWLRLGVYQAMSMVNARDFCGHGSTLWGGAG